MQELEEMIVEVKQWKEYHSQQFRCGVKGASIEAAACAIRLKGLEDAKKAIIKCGALR